MTVFPVSGVLLLIWLMLVWRDRDNALRLSIACLPLGVFAAAGVGGLSLLAAHVIALLWLAQMGLRAVTAPGGPVLPRRSPALLWLAAFMVYAVFSAVVMPRIFAGQFHVFPMTVTLRGMVVSADFPSTMVPLGPSRSNLAQAGYVLVSGAFFIGATAVFARRGAPFIRSAMLWGGLVNLAAGLLDLIGLDSVLAVLRTADYALANAHTLAGLPRVVGGFSEASIFGATSASFFAWFLMSWLTGRQLRDALLALTMLAMALLSMSSSGMATIGAALLFTLLHVRAWPGQGLSRGFLNLLVILGFALIGGMALLSHSDALMATLRRLLDALIFNKPESLSGLERSAWAAEGLNAFRHTGGWGAGAGSLRSNGYLAVLAGSLGVPGTLTFAAFMLAVLGPPGRRVRRAMLPEQAALFASARVAALTTLAGMMLSATTPDPTLLLMGFAAIAQAARQPAGLTAPRRIATAGRIPRITPG